MRKRTFAVMLVLLIVGPVIAQDIPYVLYEPSAEEYADRVEAVLDAAVIMYPLLRHEMYPVAAAAIVDEVNWRFLEQDRVTYHNLETIYQHFAGRNQLHVALPHEPWLHELIELWLNENPTILSEHGQVETETIEFDGYRIEVEPLRASLGMYGGVLWGHYIRVIEEPGAQNVGYIAVPEDGKYLLPELPAPMDSELLASGDLNNDDDPDIAYLYSAEINNSYNSGALIIASLRDDNQLEELERLSYFTGGYEFPPQRFNWWFTSVGPKETTSIVQSQNLGTNWGCSFVQIRLFGWNGELGLVNQSTENVYPATFGCLVLKAEQAMWSHDYVRAVELYEKAFATGTPPVTDLLPHAQIQLGLAYLATEQPDRADDVFAELVTSESDYAQAVLATYERDPRLLPVCQTMYRYAFDGEERLQSNGFVETYGGGFNRFEAGWFYFDVDNATCDIGYHLDAALSEMTFPVDETPLARLESLGLDLAGHLEADFNRDGANEWLFWLDAPGIDPLFFSQAGDHYVLSRPRGHSTMFWYPDDDLRQPTEYNKYQVMTLPNRTEQVIVNVDFHWDQRADINCADSCGGGGYARCTYGDRTSFPRFPGDLTIWRMQDNALVSIFLAPLCEAVDPDNLFVSPTEQLTINAGGYRESSEYSDETRIVPATYTWDESAETYILVEEPEVTTTPTLTPEVTAPAPQPEPVYTLSSFYQLRSAFAERDYVLVVDIADAALAHARETDAEQWKHAFRYYRALALEALNRPAEALSEYAAIYEADQESDWGILAALHLERKENE